MRSLFVRLLPLPHSSHWDQKLLLQFSKSSCTAPWSKWYASPNVRSVKTFTREEVNADLDKSRSAISTGSFLADVINRRRVSQQPDNTGNNTFVRLRGPIIYHMGQRAAECEDALVPS